MQPVLPQSYHSLIVCPACKSPLEFSGDTARCTGCKTTYTQAGGVWRFMTLSVADDVKHQWQHGQDEYEEFARGHADDYEQFLREIDSVREIYTDVYPIRGAVLDVGGHDGRLRHFMTAEEKAKYLIVDPYPGAVLSLPQRPNLLRAYPELSEPTPIVQGVAEALPVTDAAFDLVHMRSVLDHFADPPGALAEARRVLKAGGRLLIGLHVTGGKSSIPRPHGVGSLLARLRKKLRDQGVKKTLRAIASRVTGRAPHDEHMWHPTYDDLLALVRRAGFEIEHEHWQKPPNDHVIYLMSRKR